MIEAKGLTKRYGPVTAVDKIDLHVGSPGIVGFLGPNGAGKTTTMRMLTGFVPMTEGTAIVAGFDVFEDPIAETSKARFRLRCRPAGREKVAPDVAELALREGWRIQTLAWHPPSLEEVFLSLVGALA